MSEAEAVKKKKKENSYSAFSMYILRRCDWFSYNTITIRDFKIQRRQRQRQRPKNNRFYKQNDNFARASHFFVHFFLVFARLQRENA